MLSIDAEFNELLLVFRPNPRGLGSIGEFGEFGMALGEISSVEREIHAQWRGVVKAGLGELADIQQDIEDAKKVIMSATDIGGKIENLKSRISRLQSKLAKVKNPAAAAKIQSRISAAQPQLNIAQGAYNSMLATVNIAKDVLAKAGVVVEEAKKAVVGTATAAREKAMQAAQKAKEVALAVGGKVKAAAGAAAEAVKAAAGKVKAAAGAAAEAAKQKAAQAATAVKTAASAAAARAAQIAAQARALAAQKAAQAKALAQQAAARVQQAAAQARARAQQVAQQAQARAVQVAQQARQAVAQRAAQVTQAARSVATPVVQRAQQAASSVAKFFGFRGLGEIGVIPVATVLGAGALALTALQLASSYVGQGEAVPADATAIPATIPMADMEQYKVAASECYNSAVAQGYVVDTAEKSSLLEKTCRDRAATAYAEKAAQIPYSGDTGIPSAGGLIDEFDTSGGYVPSAGGGSLLEQMCAQDPTNPQCAQLVTQLPTGGGYYTVGAEPNVMTTEEYQAQQQISPDGRRIISVTPPVTGEPSMFDEFETLVPGVQPVPGYPPGLPTQVQVPGVTPGYEPGFAPTYAPGAEFPTEECPDIPDLTDEEYCAQFPQCCEDAGCPSVPEMTDSEYCATYPQCCEETGTSDSGQTQSLWNMDVEF